MTSLFPAATPRRPLLLLLVALALPSVAVGAGARILIEPPFTPSGNPPLNPKLAASPDGFLLTAMTSHNLPIAIPISGEGEPGVVGALALSQEASRSIGAPVFDGERWLVPYAPAEWAPETIIAILDREGREVTGSVSFPSIYPKLNPSLSWNGEGFALVRRLGSSLMSRLDVEALALTPDLVSGSGPFVVASETIESKLAAMAEGFLLVYSKDDGLWALRLDDEARPSGAPLRLSDAPELRRFEIAEGADGVLITWAEKSGEAWSVRAAVVSSAGAVEPWGQIASVEDGLGQVFPASLDGGWVVAWQGVTYTQTQSGSPVRLRRFTATGAPLGGAVSLIANPRGELLRAVASRGESVLFAWDRQLAIGRPFFGAMVTRDSVSDPRVLRLGWESIQDMTFDGSGTGDVYGAWEQRGGVESTIRLGRWNREGEFLGGSIVRSAEGLYGSMSLAWGPGHGVLVWTEGFNVLGILVDDQARPVGDFFYIKLDDPERRTNFGDLDLVWTGSVFVVTWRGGGAFLTTEIPALEIPELPPSPIANHSFGTDSTRLAYAQGRLAVVSEMTNRPDCYFPGCDPGSGWLAIAFSDAGGPVSSWDDLIPAAQSPAITTNGETFLLTFISPEGVHVRTYALDGGLLDEQIVFEGPAVATTALWDGSRYVAGWSYQFAGEHRAAAAEIDGDGQLTAPFRGFAFGGEIEAVRTGGDVMLIGRATIHEETSLRTVIIGQLLGEGELLPPPPPNPAIELLRLPLALRVSWTPAPGVEYRVMVARKLEETLIWESAPVYDDGTAYIDLDGLEVDRVRLESIGLGGASVVEISLAPEQRRRAAGR